MTKNELKTGYIIVNRGGYLGVVIRDDEDYILYQKIGMDDLDEFHDDLTFMDEDYPNGDIMEVYRAYASFLEVEHDDAHLLWQRDEEWCRPTREEIRAREEKREQEWLKHVEEMREQAAKAREETRKDCIDVVVQQFYGNRTAMEIGRNCIDDLLRGIVERAAFVDPDAERVERRVVHLPDAENIVIVYDQLQEDQYVNVDFPKQCAEYREHTGKELKASVSCHIPETGFTLHSRCIACRMDENGVFQSLKSEDYGKIMACLPER